MIFHNTLKLMNCFILNCFIKIRQVRKYVHWNEKDSGLASDEPKEFDVDKMEERAERFENLELLKRRTRKFEETVAPVLVSVSPYSQETF